MTGSILILGAGVYQVPLIVAARRRGLRAVVASRPGPYPGRELADVFLPVDIADREQCLAAAREHDIVAVATTGADAGLPALGHIVSELDLPGPGLPAAMASTDKTRMKEAFIKAGVPTAPYGLFQDENRARVFASALGYPVMVKPPASSGSRGVIRVDKVAQFAAAWQAARSHAGGGGIIVERCLIGTEFGAQAVIHGRRVSAVLIHDDEVTPPPLSTPVGHSMPTSLSAAECARVEQVVTAAVAAIGLCDCVANVDLMLVSGEPHVIEIGGRMGATGIPEMIKLSTGWDMYDHVLDLALGCAEALPPAAGKANAVVLLRGARAGTFLSLAIPPEIRNHPDLVTLQWDLRPGDPVSAFRVGPDRLGLLQVTGDTAAAARETAATLQESIRIVVEEKS